MQVTKMCVSGCTIFYSKTQKLKDFSFTQGPRTTFTWKNVDFNLLFKQKLIGPPNQFLLRSNSLYYLVLYCYIYAIHHCV